MIVWLSRALVCFGLVCAVAVPVRGDIALVANSSDAPFASPDWPQDGMVIELARAAFAASPDPLPVDLTWDAQPDQHLMLVANHQIDMALPWPQPECDPQGAQAEICGRFHYSDPLLEMVSLLFTRIDGEFPFETDEDLLGKTLCRPRAMPVYDLDRTDRQWLQNRAITLVQPDTLFECFSRLMAGSVDAVAVNEFQGVMQMFAQGLTEDVVPLPRPLSSQSLHLVISNTHWRGTTHMYRFNAGLARLRKTGQYAEILERHLTHFWSSVQRKQE